MGKRPLLTMCGASRTRTSAIRVPVAAAITQSFLVSSPLLSVHAAEHAFEANILLELPRGLIFQPVVQYYMSCGRISQSTTVPGFQTMIDFLIRRSYAGRCFH